MELPYRITGFLGYGANGSVFRADYNGTEVALKFQYGLRHHNELLAKQCRTEFRKLTRLADVAGVPNPILLLDSLSGTYDELGLALSGRPMLRAVFQDRSREEDLPDIIFSGGFLFDLVEGKRPSFENMQPKDFFDRLEQMVHQIHERDMALPPDKLILEANREPYILDWLCAPDFHLPYYKRLPEEVERAIGSDFETVNWYRERFQSN